VAKNLPSHAITTKQQNKILACAGRAGVSGKTETQGIRTGSAEGASRSQILASITREQRTRQKEARSTFRFACRSQDRAVLLAAIRIQTGKAGGGFA
jgi:hypothetical protein